MFLSSFYPLFFTLFTISSIVAIIRLADITAVVKLGTSDFFRLYVYGVPQLFFYSLPASFFVAASLALSKLSFDSEITAMTALGATKKQIIKPFWNLALLFSAILFVLGVIVVPISNSKAKIFIEEKKATSKLNLSPNSVGQKFGDWFVFALGENSKGGFTDIVLFSKNFKSHLLDVGDNKKASDKVIYSKSADIKIEEGLPVLELGAGEALIYDENLSDTNVKKLKFSGLSLREDGIGTNMENGLFVEYWLQAGTDKKRAKDLVDTLLSSISPILNIFLAFSFGVTMSRKDKNRAVIYSIIAIAIYYMLILTISPRLTFFTIPLMIFIWTLATQKIYKRSVFYRY
jgi:lipopolysaccharide export system permease protein